jgi:hypothetical protein
MRIGSPLTLLVWLAALPETLSAAPIFTPAPPATSAPPAAPATPAPAAPAPAAPAVDAAGPPDERGSVASPATPSPAPALAPPPAEPPPSPEWAPPPAPLPPPATFYPTPHPRRYGDGGSNELALALGYTKQSGFVGGGGFRRFVLDGVGPGLEATIQKTDNLTTGLVLASLKLVPLRGETAALVLTGRVGRVLLSDHDDGWGAGVGAGVIVFFSPGVGLELGYAILWLMPSRFCADLVSCKIEGPELGLRVTF